MSDYNAPEPTNIGMFESDYDDMLADQAEHHTCREQETRERYLLGVAAAHVLHHTGQPGGYAPGHYMTAILDAWDRADLENSGLLASIYPEHGWAVQQARAGAYDLLRHTVARSAQAFA